MFPLNLQATRPVGRRGAHHVDVREGPAAEATLRTTRGWNPPVHALVNFQRAGVVNFGRASTDQWHHWRAGAGEADLLVGLLKVIDPASLSVACPGRAGNRRQLRAAAICSRCEVRPNFTVVQILGGLI